MEVIQSQKILICRLCLDWLDLAIMLNLDFRQFLICGSQKGDKTGID